MKRGEKDDIERQYDIFTPSLEQNAFFLINYLTNKTQIH